MTIIDLQSARNPEDVFGSDPKSAKTAYYRLAQIFHPDKTRDVGEAMLLLNVLWDKAEKKLEAGTYGKSVGTIIRSRKHTYTLALSPISAGTNAYVCTIDSGESAILNFSGTPTDNDLLANEA